MATIPQVTRDKLRQVFKSEEMVRAYEALQQLAQLTPEQIVDLEAEIAAAQASASAAQATANAGVSAAAVAQSTAVAAQSNVDALEAAPFIMVALDGTATNERALAMGLALKATDNGPGATLVLDSSDLISLLLADIADSTAAFVDATGLLLTLEANATYLVEGLLTFQSAAITTGLALGFTLPAGATMSGLYRHNTSAIASEGSYNIASGAVKGNTSGVLVLNENVPIDARWIIKTAGTAGAAQLRFRSEVAASAVTLKAGLSVLIARRIA